MIPKKNKKLFNDFCRFSIRQLESWDIDPMYPTLYEYYKSKKFNKEEALWRTFIFVAWYHVGSAEISWSIWPEPQKIPDGLSKGTKFSTGTERRLFRGRFNDFVTHVNNFVEITNGNIKSWVEKHVSVGGEEGWYNLRQAFEKVKFNGPWASYKFADIVKNVHKYPITANDIGVGGGSETAGPIPGMVKLTGKNWKECARDIALQKGLLDYSISMGVPFNGLDQLETALCDFNSLYKGKYYSGHDIDHQMDQLKNSGASLWEARGGAIPTNFRGEVNGWFGVRKELNSLYKNKGILL